MRTKNMETRFTLRLKNEERQRIELDADLTGLSSSEIIRRRFFGRPLIAHADMVLVKELRRIGGLLKANFETMRQAKAPREIFETQEALLKQISHTIDGLGEKIYGGKEDQKQAGKSETQGVAER